MSAQLPPIAPEDLGALTAEEPDAVICRVCDTQVDVATGEPLEPVDDETVAAVREYVSGASENEEAGSLLAGDDEEII